MCGIAGIMRVRPPAGGRPPDPDALERALRDRGPDHQGRWSDETAELTLVHTRLSIVDPSPASHQPMVGERWVLVFNGEIYNFPELRRRLEAEGHRVTSEGDTEVLLRAIEAWGVEGALDAVAGMFAFAAWDRRDARLHLARDRLGIKPLYVHETGEHLVFASSPAAIVRAVGRAFELNVEALAGFFALGAPQGPHTLFSGVERVPPATHITLRAGAAPERRVFWAPRPRPDLEGTLLTAIEQHLHADVPSALLLSGGVDSSVLALAMHRPRCFHLNSSEQRQAEAVARHIGAELEVAAPVRFEEADAIITRYVRSSGEPSASALIPAITAQRMQAEGLKVCFSANGADELFFGYPRTPAPELEASFIAPLWDAPPARSWAAQLRHLFRSPENYATPDGGRMRHADPFAWVLEHEREAQLPDFPTSAAHRWLELRRYVLYDLNPTLDFATMMFSVEARVPFLDHRVVEAALTLPASELITARHGRKTPLRKLLRAGGLPPALTARKKVGFSLDARTRFDLDRATLEAVARCSRRGLVAIDPWVGLANRDARYLANACLALDAWWRVWVDEGPVDARGLEAT